MAPEATGPAPAADSYRQPRARAETEIKVKGSRFLAVALPVTDSVAARDAIASIKKRHHDATHHCSAWLTGPDAREFRHDDDGEPSGSAGLPILRQIDASGLVNVIVVVTRWFGGTKLGTGGLARAYGDAARAVLGAVEAEECVLRTPFLLEFPFEDTSPAMHALSRFDVRILETRYGTGTSMEVAIRRSQADAFEAAWVEALRGRGPIVRISP